MKTYVPLSLGCTAVEITGRTFWEFVHPDDAPGFGEHVEDLLAGATNHLRVEKLYARKDGAAIWTDLVLSLIRDPDEKPRYVVAMIENITERYHLQTDLQHQAQHDPLTGLPNRTVFFQRLDAALLTGRNQHRVGFGSIAEYPGPFPGYTASKPKADTAFPRILKENGYVTGGFGWQAAYGDNLAETANRLGADWGYDNSDRLSVANAVRFVAKRSLFNMPFMGWHLQRSGHIAVDRDAPLADFAAIADQYPVFRVERDRAR